MGRVTTTHRGGGKAATSFANIPGGLAGAEPQRAGTPPMAGPRDLDATLHHGPQHVG